MNTLHKLFGFDSTQHNVKTEIIAGVTTFLAMAYILAVNPGIFSALGEMGMDTSAQFTATALAAIIGTLIMAFYAKLPFALAPGMGLNAFFVYTICLSMGHTWQFALTAILLEGLIFILLTITNIRKLIVNAIPSSITKAIGAGIGLFIAFIGCQNAGIIIKNDATLVTLGDCTHGSALLAIMGLIISSIFIVKNIRGGLLFGIIVTTLIGIPMNITHITTIVSTPPSVAPIFCQFQWNEILTSDMFIVVFTFLFMDIFDTMGTLIGVGTRAKLIDKDGHLERVNKAFMADAIATCAGACLGTNTTTTYVESASGVSQGGRTGLTAFTTAICFALSLFLSPFFLAIPSAAIAPALIIVGLFMIIPLKEIDFSDYSESMPAFLTFILIPLAYSISDGILIGIIFYVFINLMSGKYSKLSPTLYILAIIFILKYIFI